MMNTDLIKEHENILNVINLFLLGYKSKDISNVEKYMSDIFCDEIFAIGTSAINTSSTEWCNSYDKVKKLIIDDWKYWGDLDLEIDKSNISIFENTAFVSLIGTVNEKMLNENYYDYRLDLVKGVLNNDSSSSKEKLLDIINGITDTLYETEKGEVYNWPVRLSIYLIKKDNKWLIKHLHFSYPVTFYPPVRT